MEFFLQKLSEHIADKKGFNVVALDVRGICTMTDYFLLAEGNIARHVKAIAKDLEDFVKHSDECLLHIEGMDDGEWIVIDCGRVVVHLFIPSMRDRYHFESVWDEAQLIDLGVDSRAQA